MSDFLTRMAQLSRGETPVVAPQVSGLFGPVQEDAQAETCSPPLLQQNNRAATITPGADTKPGEIVQPEPVDVVAHAEKNALGKTSPTTGPENSGAAVPLHVSPKGEDPIGLTGTSRISSQAQEAGDEVPVERPKERPDSLSLNHEQRATASTRFQQPLGSQPAPKEFVGKESPLITPLVPGYESKQSAPQQIVMEMADGTEPVTAREPTVHINIGRIEVRAQPAAPAPVARPVPPKPQSTLSLDDYLKRIGRRP